jgi:hypothetical protein
MGTGLLLGVLVALILGWMWTRRGASAGAEARLRRICFGDQGQVDRLIEGELQRTGGRISRTEAARRAVDRHFRDNR